MSDFITGRVAFGPSHKSPQDIIRLHELQIRRLKQERDEAQERCGRLLAALDEALTTIRSVQDRAGKNLRSPLPVAGTADGVVRPTAETEPSTAGENQTHG